MVKILASSTNPPIGAILTAGVASTSAVLIEWGKENAIVVAANLSVDSNTGMCRYLARACPALNLYGSNIHENTQVDHWLSFAIGPLSCSGALDEALSYLDTSLGPVTFLVGSNLTIADLVVWGTLVLNQFWNKVLEGPVPYKNINRWFSFIGSLEPVKKALELVPSDVLVKPKKEPTKSNERKEEGKFVELPGAEMGKVVVRFPPEASGFLHIGHAKAALLNQYYQEAFKGKLIMRFDDTNPDKEKVDFEKVILEDLKLLDIKPDIFTHTSNYFDLMLDLCEKLLKSGHAYVDDTDPETMKAEREQRTQSKNWDNSVDKNFKMWEEMKKGSEYGQKCCVRAKIDMSSDNGCMRDPTIYRCKNEPHPKTGDKYKVYPTYDFACPIVDSIEGVTHALRTMEYHDRDDQFYWFIDALKLRKPYIWEYSRLNMMNTVLSKRKLTWFVQEGIVESWEDPRFPTVRGVLRRGLTVEGLKQFIIAQGSSRSVVQMEWDKIWAFNKKVIDPVAPRYTALEKDQIVVVNIKNAVEEQKIVAKHPKNPDIGTKSIWTGSKVLIEKVDAKELVEGKNATFINWGNLKITKINRDNSGEVTSIDAQTNLTDTDFKKTLKLTWLAENSSTKLTVIKVLYFGHLITKPVLAKDEDFKAYINYNSKKEVEYIGDPELASLKVGDIIQLQRIGFFRCDAAYAPGKSLVLIHIPDGSARLPAVAASLDVNTNTKTASVTNQNLIPVSDAELEQIATEWITDKSAASTTTQSIPGEPDELSAKISGQGDLVRKLKTEKADKSVLDSAVKTLLALKAQFKSISGKDWQPGLVISQKIETQSTLTQSTGEADKLSTNISGQGDLVRKLKTEKADKSVVDSAVKTLLSLKADFKSLTGKDWQPGLVTPKKIETQSTLTPPSGEAETLSDKITKQGEKVRKLKTDKAEKVVIDSEVKTLLALKAQFKSLTGKDWQPGQIVPKTAEIPKQGSLSAASPSGEAESLSLKIIEQGDLVRKLKTEKADKLTIESEVKTLLTLKNNYKNITGKNWQPVAVGKQETPQKAETIQEIRKPLVVDSNIGNEILQKIADQGNKIRQLKTSKANKHEIAVEVNELLQLKSEFKSVTGIEWKQGMAPTQVETPTNESNVETIQVKITEQGNKVRDLKTAKASKDAIDDAVKVLLSLKADYKNITGTDWKPPGGGDSRQNKKPESSKKQPKTEQKVKEPSPVKDGGLKKQTRLGLEATKEDDLSEWYSQVITKGELIEYYDVSGCYILRPWSFAIWDAIKDFFDKEIRALGVQNCYFPMFVSKTVLEKEKTHVADFSPEVAWVTRSGDTELSEHIAIRPTSETVMYPAYAKWVQSYRDLPIKLNQWNSVVRWEFKHPQPFIRTREFLWQEGHTAFASLNEAEDEVLHILELYARIYTELLAIPVIKGRKTGKEKFAGGDYTTTVEAYVSASGRGIQGATSHHLGQNFSKMFEIIYEDPETQEKKFAYQNSWGISTRTIGVMIMIHADNKGLVLPPHVACIQVVIVPCGITATLKQQDKDRLLKECEQLERDLKMTEIRAKFDDRDNYSPGWKFNHWELKGVPVRIELGPKDLEQQQLVAVRRDTGEKVTISMKNAITSIKQLLVKVHDNMLAKATTDLTSHTTITKDWNIFNDALQNKNIILSPFCGEILCEEKIKKDSARDQDVDGNAPSMGAKSLCIPFDQPKPLEPTDKCIHPSCTNKPKNYTLFGRSY